MFRKLRNKFILINLVSTTAILVLGFSTVYLVAKNSTFNRHPIPPEASTEIFEEFSDDSTDSTVFRHYVEERVFEDRESSLNNLLKILIITGLSVELVVLAFSYFYAEEAIKPVKTAYESQKVFIANASHEIKTPIAAIKANLEAADLSESNHWIKNIEVEADKAEHLTLDLLKLARSDLSTTALPEKTSIELKPFVKPLLDSFEPRLLERRLKLTTSYKLDAKTSTELRSADFKELLEILLDNAVKYAGTKIRVELTEKSITVKNDGAVIPEDQLEHIFDRFYQVDKSSPGSGLGLAIAQSLASRNSWKLSADSDKTSTSFTLVFD